MEQRREKIRARKQAMMPELLTGKTRLLSSAVKVNLLPERPAMPDQESEIEKLESQFPPVSGEAFAAARARVLASGQSVLQSEGGFIFRVFPDGRKELVKQIEPPTPAVPGTKLTIK